MAIKTDDKSNVNIAPPQSQDSIPVKLYPQEIAEAMRAKAISPNLEYYFFKGRRKVSYKDILKRAQELVRKLNIRVEPSATIEGFAKNFTNSIANSKDLQPVEEELPAAMQETASAVPEEEPLTMSDKSPSNPLSSFSGSNQQGSSAPQRVVVSQPVPSTKEEVWQERVKQMEAGAQGPASEKINRMREETGPATKKIDEMRATDNPVSHGETGAATKKIDEMRATDNPVAHTEAPVNQHPAGTTTKPEPAQAHMRQEPNPPRNTSSTANRTTKQDAYSSQPSFQRKPFTSSLSRSIGNIKMPSPISSGIKNFTSSAGRFFKSNFGKYLTPGNVSRIGSSIIGGFAGMGVAGTAGAGAGALGGFVAPDLLKAGGGKIAGNIANSAINSGLNLSNRVSGIKTSVTNIAGKAKNSNLLKRSLIGIVLAMFGFSIFGNLFSTPGEASPSANQTSSSGSTVGLDYSIPFRDPSVMPLDVKNQVMATFPRAKIDYWDEIVKRSTAVGVNWNPAFVLALWIEETAASQATVVRNGGSGVPTPRGDLSLGHLGCAPLEDQTIDQSLDCLFKNFNQYSNNQFAQFMARYSGGPANSPFSNNPNFPGNIKHWYSILVPSGSGALKIVSTSNGTTRSSQVTTPSSCPVPNGTITCGSQITPVSGCGHCRADMGYGAYMANCRFDGVKDAIDIATSPSQSVFFPTINNHNISWRFVREDVGSSGYIQLFAGEDTLPTQDKYSLQIQHTEFKSGNKGIHQSGEQAATSCSTCGEGHVHVQLRSDVTGQWLDAAQILCR